MSMWEFIYFFFIFFIFGCCASHEHFSYILSLLACFIHTFSVGLFALLLIERYFSEIDLQDAGLLQILIIAELCQEKVPEESKIKDSHYH